MRNIKFDSSVTPLSPKPRIFEIAKSAGCTSREMIEHARNYGLPAKSAASSVLPVFASVLHDSFNHWIEAPVSADQGPMTREVNGK